VHFADFSDDGKHWMDRFLSDPDAAALGPCVTGGVQQSLGGPQRRRLGLVAPKYLESRRMTAHGSTVQLELRRTGRRERFR